MTKHITKTAIEDVSTAIRRVYDSYEDSDNKTSYRYAVAMTALEIRSALKKNNPTFKDHKFLEDCGIKIS
jgi:hypothetical protein